MHFFLILKVSRNSNVNGHGALGKTTINWLSLSTCIVPPLGWVDSLYATIISLYVTIAALWWIWTDMAAMTLPERVRRLTYIEYFECGGVYSSSVCWIDCLIAGVVPHPFSSLLGSALSGWALSYCDEKKIAHHEVMFPFFHTKILLLFFSNTIEWPTGSLYQFISCLSLCPM